MKKTCRNCVHLLESDKCLKHEIIIEDTTRGMGCFDDGSSSRMYQSREYCRDIECRTQYLIEGAYNSEIEAAYKERCHKCGAYKFHKWLKENNYQIRKVK